MVRTSIFVLFGRYQGDSTLLAMLNDIQGGKYKTIVEQVRQARTAGDKETAVKLKKRLPAFTPQATYDKIRKDEFLTAYNRLVILDIDHVGDDALRRAADSVRTAPYTVACFRSPSGNGLKIIAYAAIEPAPEARGHRQTYQAVSRWYAKRLGVEIDTSGSDKGRLCFVSYDPDLYLAPAFRPWLEGKGEAPADLEPLPLPSREETRREPAGPKGKRNLSPLERSRKSAERKGSYADGNRNNFVFNMAMYASRLGVSRADMESYADSAFADLPKEERQAAIGNAYSYVEEKAAGKKTKRGLRDVAAIEAYIAERFVTRKNEVRGYVEVADKKKDGAEPAFTAVSDYWVNSLWRKLQKKGYLCAANDIRSILLSDFSPSYHPFRHYFEGLPPWDGATDWIGQLADTVETTRPAFWRECLKRWLVAQVACAMELGRENHSILLLAGGQGLGKTSWLRGIVPPELRDYLFTGNIDPYSKDFQQMMADCLLIVIDEMSGQSYAELNRLKALTSNGVIYQRRPYGHYAETQIRHASFAATVNDLHALPDDNESRRFLCFETTRIDYLAPVNHAGVYAQALALFRQGTRYWFAGEEIRKINANNEAFRQRSPEEELFFTYFRKPLPFDAPQYLTASDILTKLSVYARITPTRSNILTLNKVLKKHGFNFIKSNGKRLFEVVEISLEQVKANFYRPEQG